MDRTQQCIKLQTEQATAASQLAAMMLQLKDSNDHAIRLQEALSQQTAEAERTRQSLQERIASYENQLRDALQLVSSTQTAGETERVKFMSALQSKYADAAASMGESQFLRANNARLQETLAETQQRLEQSEDTRLAQSKVLDATQETLGDLEEQIASLQIELEDTRAENQRLQLESNDHIAEQSEFQREMVLRANEEIQELETQLQSLRANRDATVSQLQAAESASDELEWALKNVTFLTDNLEKTRRELHASQLQNVQLQSRVAALEADTNHVAQDAQLLSFASEEQLQKHQAEMQQATQTSEKLQEQLLIAKQACATLQARETELKVAQAELRQCQENSGSLKSLLAECRHDLQNLNSQVGQLQAMLLSKEHELKQSQAELKQSQDHLSSLTELLAQSRLDLQTASAQNSQLQSRVAVLDGDFERFASTAQQSVQQTAVSMQEKDAQLRLLSSELKASQEHVDSLSTLVEQSQRDLQMLHTQNIQLQSRVAAQEADNTRLSTDAQQSAFTASDILDKGRKDLQAANQSNSQLQARVAVLEADALRLAAESQQLEKARKDLLEANTLVHQLQSRVAILEADATRLSSTAQQSASNSEQTRELLQKHQQELQSAYTLNSQLQSRLTIVEAEAARLSSDIQQAEQTREQMHALSARLDSANEQLSVQRAVVEQTQGQMQAKESQLQQALGEMKLAHEQVSSMTALLHHAREDLGAAKAETEQSDSLTKALQAQLTEQSELSADLQQQVESLELNLSITQSLAAQRLNELSSAQHALIDMQAENEELQEQATTLEDLVQQATERISTMQIELTTAHEELRAKDEQLLQRANELDHEKQWSEELAQKLRTQAQTSATTVAADAQKRDAAVQQLTQQLQEATKATQLMKEERDSHAEQSTHLSDRAQLSERQLVQTKQQLERAVAQVDALQQEVQAKTMQHSTLTEQLKLANVRNSELQESVTALEKQVVLLKSAVEQADNELRRRDSAEVTLQRDLHETRRSSVHATQISALELQQRETAITELAASLDQANAQSHELQTALDSAKQQLQQVREQRDSLQEQLSYLNKKADGSDTVVSSLRSTMEQHGAQVDALRSELRNSEVAIAQREASLRQRDATIVELSSEIESAQSQIAELEEKVVMQTLLVKQATDELTAVCVEHHKAVEERESLAVQLMQTKGELSHVTAWNEELTQKYQLQTQDKVSQSAAEILQRNSAIEQLSKSCDLANQDAQRAREERDSLKEQVKSLVSSAEASDKLAKSLREQLDRALAEKSGAAASAQLQKLQLEFTMAQGQILQLQAHERLLETALQHAQDEARTRTAEVQHVRGQYDALQKTVADLTTMQGRVTATLQTSEEQSAMHSADSRELQLALNAASLQNRQISGEYERLQQEHRLLHQQLKVLGEHRVNSPAKSSPGRGDLELELAQTKKTLEMFKARALKQREDYALLQKQYDALAAVSKSGGELAALEYQITLLQAQNTALTAELAEARRHIPVPGQPTAAHDILTDQLEQQIAEYTALKEEQTEQMALVEGAILAACDELWSGVVGEPLKRPEELGVVALLELLGQTTSAVIAEWHTRV
eukprot:TRINITY_DN6986_c0_g1_i1.p1 TRINITY_DN6986_c0_g1~~TRINITY_DN6986_c0_g1_i1.p1  ORF type:complete len:1682 (+),score=554.59 TRINITY_DN6986_c0_g1_i1:303-5048(+)